MQYILYHNTIIQYNRDYSRNYSIQCMQYGAVHTIMQYIQYIYCSIYENTVYCSVYYKAVYCSMHLNTVYTLYTEIQCIQFSAARIIIEYYNAMYTIIQYRIQYTLS